MVRSIEKGVNKMTVNEFLEMLDRYGIVYEDEELVIERLSDFGCAIFDKIIINKGDSNVSIL